MSRTYRVLRNSTDLSGTVKLWVLCNKKGHKKFQQIVNKRCRRLDKIAIAEGINDILDAIQEDIDLVALEGMHEDWYDFNFYKENPFEDLLGEDWLDDESYYESYYDSIYY